MTDDPDDAPELLDEFFRTGEIRVDGKIVRRGRPPLGEQPKSSVTLRLDADVLEAYRALGRGWQSQINADLRKVRKLKKA
ncbi:BrnA antitoxin family protein [Rhodopseudomonas telluris]|uniref:BrnA antitoxin family protein n=1 Tax=Rhodopseudomonas telluris TaxID=644215 RepID=A0ABV6EYM4_9BRAD